MKKSTCLFLLFILLVFHATSQHFDFNFGNQGIIQKYGGTTHPEGVKVLPFLSDQLLIVGNHTRSCYHRFNTTFQAIEKKGIWLHCIDEDGKPNPSFGENGQVLISEEKSRIDLFGTYIDDQDRIVLVTFYYPSITLIRLLPDGTIDPDFGDAGFKALPPYMPINSLQFSAEGNIFLFGEKWPEGGFAIYSLDANGQTRTDWGDAGYIHYPNSVHFPNSQYHKTYCMALHEDGKIWIGGVLKNSTFIYSRGFILGLKADGQVDNSFAKDGLRFLRHSLIEGIFDFFPMGQDKIWVSCKVSDVPVLVEMNSKAVMNEDFGENKYLYPPHPRYSILRNPPDEVHPIGNNQFIARFKGPQLRNYFCKFNQEGKLDKSFGIEGLKTLDSLENQMFYVNDIAGSPTKGFYFLGGFERNFNKHSTSYLTKFTIDGTLDTTFESTGFKPLVSAFGGSAAFSLMEGEEGNIWTTELYNSPQTLTATHQIENIFEYDKNGVVKQHFLFPYSGSRSSYYNHLHGLEKLADGRHLRFGAKNKQPFLQMVFADGSPDNSFGVNGYAPLISGPDTLKGIYQGITQTEDGNIWAVGNFFVWDNNQNRERNFAGIVSFTPDGQFNTNFNKTGVKYIHWTYQGQEINPIKPLPGNRFMLTGTHGGRFFFARFHADGRTDSSFSSDGILIREITNRDRCVGFELEEADGILTAGSSDGDFVFMKHFGSGDKDTYFGEKGMRTTDFESGEALAFTYERAEDGRMFIGGKLTKADGDEDMVVVCYNPEARIDTNFEQNGKLILDLGGQQECVYDLLVTSDNHLIIAGASDDKSTLVKIRLSPDVHAPIDTVKPILQDSCFSHMDSLASRYIELCETTTVYPNPVQKTFSICYTLQPKGISPTQQIRIRLFSLNGREIGTLLEADRQKGVHEERLCLPEGISSGHYFIVVEGNNQIEMVKILVRL